MPENIGSVSTAWLGLRSFSRSISSISSNTCSLAVYGPLCREGFDLGRIGDVALMTVVSVHVLYVAIRLAQRLARRPRTA